MDAYKVCFVVLTIMLLLHLILLLSSVILQSVSVERHFSDSVKCNSCCWEEQQLNDDMIISSANSTVFCKPVRNIQGNVLLSLCKEMSVSAGAPAYLDVVDLRRWNLSSSQPSAYGFNISLSSFESMCAHSIRGYFFDQ